MTLKKRKQKAPTPPATAQRISTQAQAADQPGEGQNARERLIRAGLEIFGESGFAAATTRQIAARAGVNLAAIPYYFGTKEELFAACIEALLAFAHERFIELRTQTLAELDEPDITRPRILALLERFLMAIFSLITDEAIRPYAPLVLREHLMPGRAFECLYERFFQPQHTLVTLLVARLCQLPPESPEAILRAHALFGQLFGYLSGRNLLLHRLQRTGTDKRLSAAEIELLRNILIGNIRTLFATVPASAESPAAAPGSRRISHKQSRKGASET